ncbi:MAG: GGDEF domain-containing protein, partial [Eubacteriales bacterium]
DYILVMLDVDNFKKMNDTKGHIFGDIILRNLAKCITDEVREEDFVVRYGGDEFLVVQTKSSEASLHALTERLDAAIEASCYMDVEISISYGFAARAIGMHNADGGAGACGQAAV